MSTDLRIAAILIPIDDLSLLAMTLKEAKEKHLSNPGLDRKGIEYHKKCYRSLGRLIKKVDYLIELHHAPTLES